jgi:TrmH family RNA methyltransferase
MDWHYKSAYGQNSLSNSGALHNPILSQSMITSKSNPKIKYIRRLLADRGFRHDEGAFVVEGTRWINELAQFQVSPNLVIVTESYIEQDHLQERSLEAPEIEVIVVSEQVMAYASDTVTPPGVLAIVPMLRHPMPDKPSLLLILDGISNPGNLGTMIRTAAAANTDAVLLTPASVDVYNPKVLRGSMGAHLRLPIEEKNWDEIESLITNMAIWIAAAGEGEDYVEIDWKQDLALIIGGEASGASHQARSWATGFVSIPLHRETESLNAAVAAGILLFEAVRQRRAIDDS